MIDYTIDKQRFTRNNIRDQHMAIVILRLDFAGITDSKELINVFDKRFPKSFKKRQEVYNRELNVTFRESDLREISDSLSLPVSVIQKEKLIRYSEMVGTSCDVTLDISQYFLCMTIKCRNNYDGLNKYVEIFKGTITLFKNENSYFEPKRLGLRKVRIQDIASLAELNTIFEDFIFPNNPYNINNKKQLETEYIDCIEDQSTHLKYNIHRCINVGVDINERENYKVVLDIDTYYNDSDILNLDINNLLEKANCQQFEIYKSCMKTQYLSSIKSNEN